MRLELLERLGGIVDEREAGRLAAAVLRAEAEDGDLVLAGLVDFRELAAQLVFGDVGAVGVQDVAVIFGNSDIRYGISKVSGYDEK